MTKRALQPKALNGVDEASATPSKLQKTTAAAASFVDSSHPCFSQLLAECGVVMSSESALGYEISVTPHSLGASISTLLNSLKNNPSIDFGSVIVEDCMDMFSSSSSSSRMLLPMRASPIESAATSSSTLPSLAKLLLRQSLLQSPILLALLEQVSTTDAAEPVSEADLCTPFVHTHMRTAHTCAP